MSQRSVTERATASAERAAGRAPSTDALFEAVGHELGRAVPYDGAMWMAIDPSTRFAAAPARFENLDAGFCDTFWHHEFHDQDALLFRDLIRGPAAAGGLHLSTDGLPGRSPRWRNFLAPQGYDDEIRFVCRTGDNTWAVGAILREKGRDAFSPEEVELTGRISTAIAPALRTRAAAAGSAPVLGAPSAPGLLLFDADGTFLSASAEADHWLDELGGPTTTTTAPDRSWTAALSDRTTFDLDVPTALTSLLASARAVACGLEPGPSRLRLRTATGRWLVLHASTLRTAAGESQIAVVIEPAKSAEIAPIVIEAYGLSARERDVVRAIARGSSTPEIAQELFLSPHTVRDYVKAVFEKTGVSSRGELVAKLFAEHYIDPMHDGAAHVH